MSASCFQAPMKRLANFKSIVKTLNNSLSVSPAVPLKNNKPLLHMTAGSNIAANNPSKNQVFCQKKKEVQSFLNRRTCGSMLKYEILNNKYDYMPGKVMNHPPIKPNSLSDDLSNIAAHHSNSKGGGGGGGGQFTNIASDLRKKNMPLLQMSSGSIDATKPSKNQAVCEKKEEGESFLNRSCRPMVKYDILNHMPAKVMISSSRRSGRSDFIEKKAVLTTKRSRNEDDCVVDYHMSKKRRCNSGLSDEENLEHSKSYGDQTRRTWNDSDVKKAVKRVVVSESESGGDLKLKSNKPPLSWDMPGESLKPTCHSQTVASCLHSEEPKENVSTKPVDSVNDSETSLEDDIKIIDEDSYKKAAHKVEILSRFKDTIVLKSVTDPIDKKQERQELIIKIKGIEAKIRAYKNGNYEKIRSAARMNLEKVVKTVEFNDNNMECMEHLHRLYNIRLFDLNHAPTHFPKPLEWLGLSLKGD